LYKPREEPMPPKIGFSSYSENFPGSAITDEEWAFMKAVAAYQRRWGRRYPSWREVLHVLLCLGYRKVAAPRPFIDPLPGEVELAAAVKPEIPSPKSEPAAG
jgi:hypothetical protein